MKAPIRPLVAMLQTRSMEHALRTLLRLSLGLCVVLALCALFAGIGLWSARQVNARFARLADALSDVLQMQTAQSRKMVDSIVAAVPATPVSRTADTWTLARSLARPVSGRDLIVILDASGEPEAWFDARGEGFSLGAFGVQGKPEATPPARTALYLPHESAGSYWRMLDGEPALVSVSGLSKSPGPNRHRVAIYAGQAMDALLRTCTHAGMVCSWQNTVVQENPMAFTLAPEFSAQSLGLKSGRFEDADSHAGVWRLVSATGEASLYLVARLDKHALRMQALTLCLLCTLALIPALLLSNWVSVWLARRGIVQPFQRMRELIDRMHAGQQVVLDTAMPAGESGGGELAELQRRVGALATGHSERLRGISAWAAAVAQAREAIFMMDEHGRVTMANEAYLVQSGADETGVIGQTVGFIASGLYDDGWSEELWKSLSQKGGWTGEVRDVRSDGRTCCYWLSLSTIPAEGEGETHYLGIMSDISRRKEQEDRLQYLAQHDALTGLPNRDTLMDRIRVALAQAQREGYLVAVLFIDLDRFKQINDTLGHAVGDALLNSVAERLKRAVRAADTVSRLGADEFVILLHKLRTQEDAARVAEHILASMSPTARVEGHELSITPSIGVAVFPDDAVDADELMRNADIAMYHAKSEGRNNYQFFQREMTESAEESLSLEHALRRATDRDEFQLYYQPQVDIGSRKLVGVEALIRWKSEEFGMVPPVKFVRLAEECGLIPHIGNWVLREACRQRAEWDADGLERFPIAVNVSALQFRQGDFVRRVEEALQLYGIQPQLLELELTERIVMHEAEATAGALTKLREMGVTLSIDDFGTGYSSMSYLKQLPVQRLKIDGSFVRGIEHDKADRAIVEAIISLGRALDLDLVAEGVEERTTITMLGRLGCKIAQGYFYCKPLPPADFVSWYREFSGSKTAALER